MSWPAWVAEATAALVGAALGGGLVWFGWALGYRHGVRTACSRVRDWPRAGGYRDSWAFHAVADDIERRCIGGEP